MAVTIRIFVITLLNCWILRINAGSTRLQDFRAGLESENEISDLDDQLKKLSTAQDTEGDDSFVMEHRSMGNLTCQSCQPPNCDHPKLCHKAIRCYTAHVRDTDGYESKSKGCTRNHAQNMFHCSTVSYDGRHIHKKNNRSAQYDMQCCSKEMCNQNITFRELPPVPVSNEFQKDGSESGFNYTYLIIFAAVGVALVLLAMILFKMNKNHNEKMKRLPFNAGDNELDGLFARPVGDSTLRNEFNNGQDFSCEVTSGSGSGFPKLVERSFAKDIVYSSYKIGGGRYGEVWKGTYRGDEVAVKIFNTRDEDSFKRETRIYNTYQLHHDNILRYIGTDVASINSCTSMLLVTQYHERGSLYDYLSRPDTSLTQQIAFKLIESALKGLDHLHKEVHAAGVYNLPSSEHNKHSIAHRDIKSKNILVRGTHPNDLDISCVLADFGLAVSQKELPEMEFTHENNTRVGTKRYMSPEVLDFSIIKTSKEIEAFKKSDMYSFSLVIWEILRKTRIDDTDDTSAEDFELPYYQYVTGPDPSFEEMKKIVCDGQRPNIPNDWRKNQFLTELSKSMVECWHETPNKRLTTLNLMKKLNKLKDEFEAQKTLLKPSRGVYVSPPVINHSS